MSFILENNYTLTAMVQAKTPERTVELIKKGIEGGADAFGVQLEVMDRKYHSKDIISKIIASGEGRPFYITNYANCKNEGLTDEELADEMLSLADLDNVMLDVMGDIFDKTKLQITYDEKAVAKQKQLIKSIHSKGAQVLMSTHTNCFITPKEVLEIAKSQIERGADISKIVICVNNETELYSGFETSALLARELKHPFLFLCAGEYCKLHRTIAPAMSKGLVLCVPEYDELATPIQILLSKAKKIIDIINK